MKIKNITYQRVLNLGNYESKRLEMTAEIHEGDDLEYETSFLMEIVERKVREQAAKEFEKWISDLEQQRDELVHVVSELRHEVKKLGKIKDEPLTEVAKVDIPDPF